VNYRDISKEWLDYAVKDLASARFLRKMKPHPLEIICFHCQQPNRSCAEIDDTMKELYSSCEHLNDFSVQIRYPTAHELSEKDIPEALRNAGEVLNFVKAKLAE